MHVINKYLTIETEAPIIFGAQGRSNTTFLETILPFLFTQSFQLDTVFGYLLLFVTFIFLFLQVLFFTTGERKILALTQRRVGPGVVGDRGRLQYFADALKLITKTYTSPRNINSLFFQGCAIAVFWLSWFNFSNLTFCSGEDILGVEYNIFFAICCSLGFSIAWLVAGWASVSKYALLGCVRAAIQIISYELITSAVFLNLFVITGTTNFELFIDQQEYFPIMLFFPVLGIMNFIAALVETNRPPFDLSEAESDLVSGYNTEYAGILFGLFYLSEYVNLFTNAFIIVIVFFGAWWSVFNYFDNLINVVYYCFLGSNLNVIFVDLFKFWGDFNITELLEIIIGSGDLLFSPEVFKYSDTKIYELNIFPVNIDSGDNMGRKASAAFDAFFRPFVSFHPNCDNIILELFNVIVDQDIELIFQIKPELLENIVNMKPEELISLLELIFADAEKQYELGIQTGEFALTYSNYIDSVKPLLILMGYFDYLDVLMSSELYNCLDDKIVELNIMPKLYTAENLEKISQIFMEYTLQFNNPNVAFTNVLDVLIKHLELNLDLISQLKEEELAVLRSMSIEELTKLFESTLNKAVNGCVLSTQSDISPLTACNFVGSIEELLIIFSYLGYLDVFGIPDASYYSDTTIYELNLFPIPIDSELAKIAFDVFNSCTDQLLATNTEFYNATHLAHRYVLLNYEGFVQLSSEELASLNNLDPAEIKSLLSSILEKSMKDYEFTVASDFSLSGLVKFGDTIENAAPSIQAILDSVQIVLLPNGHYGVRPISWIDNPPTIDAPINVTVDSASETLPKITLDNVTKSTLENWFLEFEITPRETYSPSLLRDSMNSLFFDYETIRQMAALYIKLHLFSLNDPAFVSIDLTKLELLFDVYINTLSANLSGYNRTYDSTLSTLILYPETTALLLNHINEVISSKPGLLVNWPEVLQTVPRDVAIRGRTLKIEDFEYLAKNGLSPESQQVLSELVYRDMFTGCYAEKPDTLTLDTLDKVKSDIRYSSYVTDHLYNLEQLAKSCDSLLNFSLETLITSKEDISFIITHGQTLNILKAIDSLLIFEMTGLLDPRYISVLEPGSEVWEILVAEPLFRDILIRSLEQFMALNSLNAGESINVMFTRGMKMEDLTCELPDLVLGEPLTPERRRELLRSNYRVLDFLIDTEAKDRHLPEDYVRNWVQYGDGLDFFLTFQTTVDQLLTVDAYLHPGDRSVIPTSDLIYPGSEMWEMFKPIFNYTDDVNLFLRALKDANSLNDANLRTIERYGKIDSDTYKILSSALLPDTLSAMTANFSDLPEPVLRDWLRLLVGINVDFLYNYERYESLIKVVNSVLFNGYPYGRAFPVGYYFDESILQEINDYKKKEIMINWTEDISVDYASAGESFFEQSVMSLPDSLLDRWFIHFIYDSIIWSEETKRRKIQAAVEWWWLCVPPC